jgi:hypothetical protein
MRSSVDPRPYLRDHYTNDNDEVCCQICGEPNGFFKRDGSYYFESVEAFKPNLLSREHEVKYLCLCANCSAKYDEFIRYSRNSATDEMHTLYSALLNTDGSEIPITLGEEKTTIRFEETHLGDLKAIIRSESCK